ncbi:MAG: type II toxin-antitoxin system HicA family toxin [Acidobacteria bacterium]|nr:type II toxin-antitoxin system HicA family toxin [Acidobacteriota bacterium]MCX6598934.1 type II toxin-antitoxin system HicA family toxin [Acidobacteriota bacterium]
MKRHELIRRLARAGCIILRHGHKHDIFINPRTSQQAPVPRHVEIRNTLCAAIEKQLGIAEPRK